MERTIRPRFASELCTKYGESESAIKLRIGLRTAPLNDLSHRNNVVLSVVPPLRPHHSSSGSGRSAFGLNLRHQAAIEAKLARFEEFVQRALDDLRIPIYSGRVFRREAGHRSDLKPATIPK
jgi:hypothetical protein